MGEVTDKQRLGALGEDDRLLELDRYVPPLRIVRSLGVERHEVAHSRLLAALFDPRRHRGAEIMLRAFLRGVLRHRRYAAAGRMRDIVDAPWTGVVVQREFKFVDIVVQISTSSRALVLGIENKIDAGEGEEQLGRYQDALENAFPGRDSILVFLTPTEREPATAVSDHPVSTVPVGYDLVVEAAEAASWEAEPGGRDRRALSEIAAHLREDILGEETEVKALVRELWRNHGRALRLALENRPRLEDIRSLYEALLRERFGDDAFIHVWQPRVGLREIKLRLRSWESAGFPFEFMLRVDDDGLPQVRLLLWWESFDARASTLREWAREVSASDPALIDQEFPKIPHWWGWRRVLQEEDYPPEAVLNEHAFDEATARAAAEAVTRYHDRLQPYIGQASTHPGAPA